jgi:uncharacterized membrane protein
MTFILFLAIIGLFFYLQNISGRLARLERAARGGQSTQYANAQTAAAPMSTPGAARMIDATPISAPVAPMLPAEGLHRPVSDISPAQWVAGVGVVALIFGIAFFFKYAIDQGWITEWGRVGIGLVVGILLLVLGELWKSKYTKYSQVLSGGGLAILYFTVFAAYQFYHLLDQPIAFLFTIIITILGIVLSYRYSAKMLGLLAVAGGYLSPLLVDSNQDQHIGLFVYLTILNIGVLLMLLRRYWVELLFLALLGTGLDFSVWALDFSSWANTGASVAFLVFNYLLVGIITATVFRKLHEAQQLPKDTDVHLGIFYTIFGVATFGTVAGLLYDPFHGYLAPIMLLLGVITFLSYAIMDRLEYVKINYPLSLVGAKFLVAAILWQFGGSTENIYLLAAGGLGMGVGFLVKRKDLRVWGLVLFLLASLKVLVTDYTFDPYTVIFNARFGMQVLVAVLLLAVGAVYEKMGATEDEIHVPAITRGFAAAVVWLGVSQEIISHFSSIESYNTRNLLLSVWWMLYAVILALLGGFRGMRVFRKAAVLLFAITVLKVFLYDVQALELGYRVVSFILLGVILLCVAFVYQKNRDKLQKFWEGERTISNS